MLHKRQRLVGRVEGIGKLGLVGGLGTRDLVGSIWIAEVSRIEAGFSFSVAETVALLLLRILGPQVVFKAVESGL